MKHFLLALAAATLAACLAVGVWFYQHPCIREEPAMCTYSECRVWMPMTINNVTTMYCSWWEYREASCMVCAEREP